MRPFLLLILTISATAFSASAWGETPKEKWEGYKPVSKAELPPQVREFAENSVFYMQTVDATPAPGTTIEILDFEKDKEDPRIKTKITDPKILRSDLTALQIETCRKQKLKRCPIATAVSKGTVFVNSGKAYTCRHGFHNWLALAATENNMSVSEISPPMIVSKPANGKSGKVVYNSAYDSMMKFNVINNSPELNVKYDELDPAAAGNNSIVQNADFIEMLIPSIDSRRSLPVKNITSFSVKGEEIYTFGYPGKTDFGALGEGNSPGLQLSITNGYVLGKYSGQNTIFSTNFSSKGMSGGPVVTKDGNLAGMVCSTFDSEKSNTQPELVNAGFFALDKNQMEKFWNSIDLAQETTQDSSSAIVN